MARRFNLKTLLQKTSVNLLLQYLNSRDIPVEFKSHEPGKVKPAVIFKAWAKISDSKRAELEVELRQIYFLATEKGEKALILAAAQQGEDLAPVLTGLKNYYDRAIFACLKRPAYWNDALRLLTVENTPPRYWRKRRNIPKNPALTDAENIGRFQRAIGDYFHQKEGLGENCHVDYFKKKEIDQFIAYPEDYARTGNAWVGNKFKRHPCTPAFEVFFVYSEKEGTLDINFPGNRWVIPDLQEIFAEIILGTNIGPEKKDVKVFDLAPLKQKGFQFVYGPTDGVKSVKVRKLRITNNYDNSSLQFEGANPLKEMYKVFNGAGANAYTLSDYDVTKAQFEVRFDPNLGPANKNKYVFTVTCPNSCTLGYFDGRESIIRKMLTDSGLER